jgi:hypothetical protein
MKRLNTLLRRTGVTLVVLYCACVIVLGATTTLTVYPGNLEGWQIQTSTSPAPTPEVRFVFGPGTPPLGRGSVELRVGPHGDSAAQLRHPGYAGTLLPNPSPTTPAANELTGLSYSTYVQQPGSGGQAPYIILNVDYNNDGTADDNLFFEPLYQDATFCPANPQPALVNGQWQTWDAFNGCWWSVAGTAGATPGAGVKQLRTITAAQPNARIVNTASGLGGVRLVAGFGAGAWDNFVGNADAFTISVGADTTIYDFEPVAPPTPATGGVIITELRTSGPGPGAPPPATPSDEAAAPGPVGFSEGTDSEGEAGGAGGLTISGDSADTGGTNAPACCDEDDYVELYNTASEDISVQSSDGSSGWALVKRGATCVDPPVIVAVIPNGTVIPARGHYLLAGSEYSLSGYPSGNGAPPTSATTATPDQVLTADINDNRSVALFNTSNPSNFDAAHRLDAVGIDAGSGSTCDLLSEGGKLLAPRGSTDQWAFVRKENAATGNPIDTNNNAADFWTVSTTPQNPVGDNPTPVLGAPGPQNTSSPIQRNGSITQSLIAPTLAASQAPNRQRDFNVEQCADQGNLYIRRTFTNNTGSPVTRLRFRVVDLTTFNSPGYSPSGGQADLRVRNSPDETLFVPGRGTVQVNGLSRETPPNQPPPNCGGINTSLTHDDVTLATPLAPGASTDVVFRLGVMQSGTFRFYIYVEALP